MDRWMCSCPHTALWARRFELEGLHMMAPLTFTVCLSYFTCWSHWDELCILPALREWMVNSWRWISDLGLGVEVIQLRPTARSGPELGT